MYSSNVERIKTIKDRDLKLDMMITQIVGTTPLIKVPLIVSSFQMKKYIIVLFVQCNLEGQKVQDPNEL